MKTLYILAPAYNESENISSFVEEWYPVVRRHNERGTSRLIIIDDGSFDGTYERLKELAADRPLLVPISKDHSGHGPTVMRGYEYALENGADYIFQTDSDRQTTPDEFEEFVKDHEKYEAIFGVRTERKDGFVRKAGGALVRRLVKHYTGGDVPDANAPYRLMSREFLEECMSHLEKNSAVPNILITSLSVSRKKNIIFRPVTFRKRVDGMGGLNIAGLIRLASAAKKELKKIKRCV